MEYKNDRTANRRRYKSRYHSPHSYKTKPAPSGNRAAILIGVATFVVLSSLVLVFTFGDSIYAFLDNLFHPSTLGIMTDSDATLGIEIPTEAPTEEPEPEPTEAPVTQSDEFNRLLAASGLEIDQLNGSQMIFVEGSGTEARVYTFEADSDGLWTPKFDAMHGYLGAGGVSESVGPYDDTTPVGNYKIEYAFGTNGDPGTLLDYYPIYYGMKWITDPSSVNYNRLVYPETIQDWDDCQELHEYTRSYPYAVVFDYNRDPVDPEKGCARFLHVASGDTYGGVGVSENDLYQILMWLDPECYPTISIF